MLRIPSLAAFLLFIGLVLVPRQPDVEGCAPAPRPGYTIRIAEESAVIVWDSSKKIEHFIRQAAFDTKSPDFGFLVPTPTQPLLAEVSPALFSMADRWIQPQTVEQTRYKFDAAFCCLGGCSRPMAKSGALAPPAVRVLAEQKVGGFDATVLEADETEALAKWLRDHEYASNPELQSWLAPYVTAKWKITAFKIIQDPKTGELATTKPVRMSFATDRPFFPYREPAAKKAIEPKKISAEPANLEGVWQIESAETNGKPIAQLKGETYHFHNGAFSNRNTKDTNYTVDAAKEPKWLDVGNMKGIFRIDGDTLHWCRATDVRPTQFDSKDGTLLVLKRDKRTYQERVGIEKPRVEIDRVLRVHFISDTRVEGKLGNAAAWHATVPWSDQLSAEQRADLVRDASLTETDLPANAWMTTFEDRASPRPGKDEVYFDPAQDRSPIRPPDRIIYNAVWIPIDVVLLGILFVGLFGALMLRKRASRKQV